MRLYWSFRQSFSSDCNSPIDTCVHTSRPWAIPCTGGGWHTFASEHNYEVSIRKLLRSTVKCTRNEIWGGHSSIGSLRKILRKLSRQLNAYVGRTTLRTPFHLFWSSDSHRLRLSHAFQAGSILSISSEFFRLILLSSIFGEVATSSSDKNFRTVGADCLQIVK